MIHLDDAHWAQLTMILFVRQLLVHNPEQATASVQFQREIVVSFLRNPPLDPGLFCPLQNSVIVGGKNKDHRPRRLATLQGFL